MFEFKQDLPVQLDAFPVSVFYGHDVSLKEPKEKIRFKPSTSIKNTIPVLILDYKPRTWTS